MQSLFSLLGSIWLLVGLSFSVNAAPLHNAPVIEVLHEFPNNTWIENGAILPNGSIIVSSISEPSLFLLDPAKPKTVPILVHSFPDRTGLLGLAQPSPNTLAIVAGNISLDDLNDSRNWAVILLDLCDGQPASVRATYPFPEARLLNGATTVPHRPDLLLIADSILGVVWRLNLRTGAVDRAVADPALTSVDPPPADAINVNGVHARGCHLFFTNSNQRTLGRVAITPQGAAAGPPAEVVANLTAQEDVDDFALGRRGTVAFVATGPRNEIVRVGRGGETSVVASGSMFHFPTSVLLQTGRKGPDVLYVTTAGSLAGVSGGGQVVKVTLPGT